MNQENYKEEFSKEDYMAMREAAKNIVNEIHQDYNGSEKDKLDLAQQAIYDKRLNIRQLKAEDKLLTKAIKENSHGIAVWKICILIVLVSLSAEILLIKFLK